MDPSGPDYVSDCDYDVPPQIIEYDPYEFPFMQEDSIDTLLTRIYEYKEKLAKYHGKEPGSIQILKKEDEEREETIKRVVNIEPPSYPYIEHIPYINFSQRNLSLMWDKRNIKPMYDQRDDNSWLGPYIVKKMFDKQKYYMPSLDGRNIPLPIDGCLLQPYVWVT
jgi:hypothetical protein